MVQASIYTIRHSDFQFIMQWIFSKAPEAFDYFAKNCIAKTYETLQVLVFVYVQYMKFGSMC